MATLSRKTIGLAISRIEWWSQPTIEHFFYENDIPDNLVLTNTSKLKMVLNVFKALEREGDYPKILSLIEAAVLKLRDEHRTEVEQALLRDGFAVAGDRVIDAEPEAEEQRSAVAVLIDKYDGDLGVETLSHHLAECEDLFRQEKWDSSIAHCRNFVEQLLNDVATALAAARADQPNLSQPRLVREYLQSVAFFDEPERKKLVDGVYGYFSEEGSHPGISTHSAARISKSILLSFAFYVLEKFDAWKTGGLKLS